MHVRKLESKVFDVRKDYKEANIGYTKRMGVRLNSSIKAWAVDICGGFG